MKDSLQQRKEKQLFCQKTIENLAAFGNNQYHKFQVTSMLILNYTEMPIATENLLLPR
jgi:hypothetical protein